MNNLNGEKLINSFGFALSNFALIFTYSLCCGVALGQGLIAILFCSSFCSILSLVFKEDVFCPDALLLVPAIYVFSESSFVNGMLSIVFGSLIFLIFRKLFPKIKINKFILNGFKITLALCVTILLTNIYFGIGSEGNTPFKMLSSYVSLGFHPHFMGLLTGTITLFMMITYPFKFKKLNKYLPAEFISLAVPFLINLIINPDRDTTAINEAINIAPLSLNDFSEKLIFDIETNNLITGSLFFAICFFILFSPKNEKQTRQLGVLQIIFAAFSGVPVSTRYVRGVNLISTLTALSLSIITCILFPSVLSRVPLHSIGALLIVSAWQQVFKGGE